MRQKSELKKEKWLDAARKNDIETIQKMIKKGIDVDTLSNYGWTALYLACWWGNIDIAKLLIKHGADITFKDKDGSIPLDELKSYPQKYEELIEWLTENHPEKLLELMASEKTQSNGVGL